MRLQDIAGLAVSLVFIKTLEKTTIQIALLGAAIAAIGFIATLMTGNELVHLLGWRDCGHRFHLLPTQPNPPGSERSIASPKAVLKALKSSNPASRLKDLQTLSGFTNLLIKFVRFGTLDVAMLVVCLATLAPALILMLCCSLLSLRKQSQPPADHLGHARFCQTPRPPRHVEPNDIEKRAFEQTNLVRVKNGLPPFTWDADVCRMARIHSESMSRNGYFSHVTPEGLRLRDRARVAGILQYSVLGENIAYNQGYDDPGAFAVEQMDAIDEAPR